MPIFYNSHFVRYRWSRIPASTNFRRIQGQGRTQRVSPVPVEPPWLINGIPRSPVTSYQILIAQSLEPLEFDFGVFKGSRFFWHTLETALPPFKILMDRFCMIQGYVAEFKCFGQIQIHNWKQGRVLMRIWQFFQLYACYNILIH